jgi:hypothetical protein
LEASWRSWSEPIRLSTGLSASQASEKRVDLSSAAGNRGLFLWRSPDGRALLARALAADLLLQVRCAVLNGKLGPGFGQLFEAEADPTTDLAMAA